MKPSELPKDGNFSGRINKKVLERLKDKGLSVQKILDSYIDQVLKVDSSVKWRHERREK